MFFSLRHNCFQPPDRISELCLSYTAYCRILAPAIGRGAGLSLRSIFFILPNSRCPATREVIRPASSTDFVTPPSLTGIPSSVRDKLAAVCGCCRTGDEPSVRSRGRGHRVARALRALQGTRCGQYCEAILSAPWSARSRAPCAIHMRIAVTPRFSGEGPACWRRSAAQRPEPHRRGGPECP